MIRPDPVMTDLAAFTLGALAVTAGLVLLACAVAYQLIGWRRR